MLLTITTTHQPATDLGYLLHKHPDRSQSFDLPFGRAHVFYPEASEARCAASLLLDVDPVGLVRNRGGTKRASLLLQQYVNDRPYVASSLLSVAMSRVFGTAMAGRCKERPDLPDQVLPLEADLAALPCRGGVELLCDLFEPLGYAVSAERHALDPMHPEWGDSGTLTVNLRAECRLQDLLTHLYVLVPVLDDEKHYWVGEDEVDKLVRRGECWLASHPAKELIARRYLKHRTGLAQQALTRLSADEGPDPDEADATHAREEELIEQPLRLNEQRIAAVVHELEASGAKRVVDLGCGEGRLLRELMATKSFAMIAGLDVSHRALEIAHDRLKLGRLPAGQRDRILLIHGSLTYRDSRIAGFDAAAVVEVIEHLDRPRLAAFERVLFECARPATIVLSTPNVEYNVRFETSPTGRYRHQDHRFEWTRQEFQAWANGVAERHGYSARFQAIGPDDPEVGSPTQMVVFTVAVEAEG